MWAPFHWAMLVLGSVCGWQGAKLSLDPKLPLNKVAGKTTYGRYHHKDRYFLTKSPYALRELRTDSHSTWMVKY